MSGRNLGHAEEFFFLLLRIFFFLEVINTVLFRPKWPKIFDPSSYRTKIPYYITFCSKFRPISAEIQDFLRNGINQQISSETAKRRGVGRRFSVAALLHCYCWNKQKKKDKKKKEKHTSSDHSVKPRTSPVAARARSHSGY